MFSHACFVQGVKVNTIVWVMKVQSVQTVPSVVEGLAAKNVIQIAVGALHCLALTSNGEVVFKTKTLP